MRRPWRWCGTPGCGTSCWWTCAARSSARRPPATTGRSRYQCGPGRSRPFGSCGDVRMDHLSRDEALPALATAYRDLTAVVTGLDRTGLAGATRCAGWTVLELVYH